MPRSLIGFDTGISFCSSAIDTRSRSLRLATASGTDLLRVMISKSLNFIFSVTVRPRVPLTEASRRRAGKIRNFEDVEVLILEQLGERILHELEDGCCFDPTYPQVR